MRTGLAPLASTARSPFALMASRAICALEKLTLAPALEVEFGGGRRDLHRHRRLRAGKELAWRRQVEHQADRLAVPIGVAARLHRAAAKVGQHELRVDLVDLLLLPRACVEIGDRAIDEADIAEMNLIERAGRACGRLGARRRRRRGLGRRRRPGRRRWLGRCGELPVGMALLVDLESDDRVDENEAVDDQPARQQRDGLYAKLELAERRHVLRARARRIAEGDVAHGEGKTGQHR